MNRRTALKNVMLAPLAVLAACRDMTTESEEDNRDYSGLVREGQQNLLQSLQADLRLGTERTSIPGLFVRDVNGQKDDWIIFIDRGNGYHGIFKAANFSPVRPGMRWRVVARSLV